ncbi:hypothetical protein BDY17DRAFT_302722 [Neohortaea acidophila]|uniref:NAD(P)-binding protein n=1 Tax=Neohortaea acidophila TaxID=245834 RepID=A0A6A6PKM4_9PEZI|nr:uncharacterized protein BDY17DRAFT_302722 [Neohortaea acidophila]KAF2479817.1 hypothetical protein BDY17DRAFT_302722 [Neohortaea acidophila]
MTESTQPLGKIFESYPFIAPEKYTGTLKGKVVIVTGASAGIGKAIATAFARAGASVAAVARREDNLNTLVKETTADGGHAIAVVGDVSKRGGPKEIVAKVEATLGPIDILVNNAGIARLGPLEMEDEDLDIWWRVHEVNVRAPVTLIRAVLPGMMERKSGIVMTVSSNVATLDLPTMSAYNSSKAAVSKFHEAITHELEGSGITSFAVHPGQIPSELGQADGAINTASLNHFAVKRFMAGIQDGGPRQTPESAADTMVALAADPRSKVLHGHHVNADQDLEAVLKEAEKEGKGRIGKEQLYKVRIGQL